jgi:hypothetical protein
MTPLLFSRRKDTLTKFKASVSNKLMPTMFETLKKRFLLVRYTSSYETHTFKDLHQPKVVKERNGFRNRKDNEANELY